MTPAPVKPMQQQHRRQQQQQPTQSLKNNFISDIITKFETKTSTADDNNKISGTHTITPNDNNNYPFKIRKHFSVAARPSLVQFEMHSRECDSDDQEIFYNSNGSVLINNNAQHHIPQMNYQNNVIKSTNKFSQSNNSNNNNSIKYGGSKKFDKIFELISWLPLSLLSLTGMGVTCLVAAFIMPRAIIHMILYPGFRLLFGTLYPAYRSYKAVRTKNVKEYVSILKYIIGGIYIIFLS